MIFPLARRYFCIGAINKQVCVEACLCVGFNKVPTINVFASYATIKGSLRFWESAVRKAKKFSFRIEGIFLFKSENGLVGVATRF